jgi:serpin B
MINPETKLFLANAIYFKGKWLEPFDVKHTKERVFHSRPRQQSKVMMMEQTRTFTYRKGTGYQAVRLPYDGCRLALYVFLPDANSNAEELLGIMSGDTWQRVTEPGFSGRQGTLVLPRFKVEYGVELKRPLMELGMRSVFGKADLSGISTAPLFVSAVRQKAFVEVNEEGTEAAGVTGLTMQTSAIAVKPPKPFQMIVDRPFVFLIHDAETNMILFMGIIQDPLHSA